MAIVLDGKSLTIDQVVQIARHHERVEISEEAKSNLIKARDFVDQAVQNGEVIYGITTGFGNFKNVTIDAAQTAKLQENLMTSHAIGVGDPLSEECVRASIVVRINSLLHGFSGVRPVAIDRLVELLNKDVYPFVPEKGSVGSSGDLCPLSHIMLVILGLGEVLVKGQRRPSSERLKEKGIEPIELTSKEGLALNNGTAVQTGIGVLAVYDAQHLAKLADVTLSMSLDVMMGTNRAFDRRVHELRPHQGQLDVSDNVRALSADSEIMNSHEGCDRVQDCYSLRCAGQVHGACRDGIYHAERVLTTEINSVTDNPLVFPDANEVISCGNFHGEPVALVMDYLSTCAAELGNISERRTAKMLDMANSEGLPAFLIDPEKAGLNNGFMIAQYTAAALVSENKVLAHPASVDSIPTSANQEDHVSMGTIAARQAREIIANTQQVIGIEAMCAAQGYDFRAPLKGGQGAHKAYELIRAEVPALDKDRVLYPDLEKTTHVILNDNFLSELEKVVGKLK